MIDSEAVWESGCPLDAHFVAVNYITCRPEYRDRFEELFATRAKAIDRMPGFCGMQVLRPHSRPGRPKKAPKGVEGQGGPGEAYLIVSFWRSGEDFEGWTGSPEFLEGHKRGFEDVRKAKEEGREPPMRSDFQVYEVIAR
jgi:heme oxygenase (mycobilin-producing)